MILVSKMRIAEIVLLLALCLVLCQAFYVQQDIDHDRGEGQAQVEFDDMSGDDGGDGKGFKNLF